MQVATDLTRKPLTSGSMAAAIVLTVVGASAFLVMPVLLGAAVADLGLSAEQVGYLGSAGLAGSAVSAIVAAALVRNLPWRLLGTVSLACQIAGLLLAAAAADFESTLWPIVLASLGGGALYSLALTILSDHPKSARLFGFSVTAQVAFQVIGLACLSLFTRADGFAYAMWVLAGLAGLGLAMVPLIPARNERVPAYPTTAQGKTGLQLPALLALLGCGLFFINIGAFWAYVERIGASAGFAPATLGTAMAGSVAFGMAGSLSAAWQGRRLGYVIPLSAAALATCIALSMLLPGISLIGFVAGFALYNFAWNYSLAYQYDTVAQADTSGRLVAAAPALHAVGGAIGPALAAGLIAPDNLVAVNWLAGAAVVLSAAAFLPAARAPGR